MGKLQMPDSRTERFDSQVAPHLGMLLRVAYRLVRNTADAQDLVQETCIAACENRAGIGAAEHPVRWLLNVLNKRFIDRGRRLKRSSLVGLEEADAAAPLVCERPGPEESLLRSDAESALIGAYLKLEEAQRTLLVLRAEGYDLTEIESITGLPKEVLRARLHRARRSLARHVDEQTGATAAALRIGSKT
jgi:RNA polymerase sigma-70 factor, ECF subfamily